MQRVRAGPGVTLGITTDPNLPGLPGMSVFQWTARNPLTSAFQRTKSALSYSGHTQVRTRAKCCPKFAGCFRSSGARGRYKLTGGCQLVMVSRWQEDCCERTGLFTCLFIYRPYFGKINSTLHHPPAPSDSRHWLRLWPLPPCCVPAPGSPSGSSTACKDWWQGSRPPHPLHSSAGLMWELVRSTPQNERRRSCEGLCACLR